MSIQKILFAAELADRDRHFSHVSNSVNARRSVGVLPEGATLGSGEVLPRYDWVEKETSAAEADDFEFQRIAIDVTDPGGANLTIDSSNHIPQAIGTGQPTT